jgi:3-hydroxyisobutyrate dehydrogenase-like beta-hydroxyacid dehydrogenase
MAKEDFDSRGGTLASFSKSLELVRQLAADTNAAIPLLEVADTCYKQALELGCGGADISSVLRVFSRPC